jgi:hypothetical protein
MKVIGLAPTSVRLDLKPCELPVLIDELLLRVEVQSSSLREEQPKPGCSINNRRLQNASNWLLEYRNLLGAVSGDYRSGDAPVSVITPMVVAETLVRACSRDAGERLMQLLGDAHSDRERLRPAAGALSAWVDTLADLRYVDEEGLEAISLD